MAQNHEIRFKCEKELIDKTVNAWKSVGKDLYKASFYRNVFVLGLNEIQKQVINQKNNIASNLLKREVNKK